jgi:hypothetical protein
VIRLGPANRPETSTSDKETSTVTSLRRLSAQLAVLAAGLLALLLPVAAQAAPGPAWEGHIAAESTNVYPGGTEFAEQYDKYFVDLVNVGGGPTAGPITMTMTLTGGPTPIPGQVRTFHNEPCTVGVPTAESVTCVSSRIRGPGDHEGLEVFFDPGSLPEGAQVGAEVTVTGGDAPEAQLQTTNTIGESAAPFDFLPGSNGLSAALTDQDGLPATQAGSHPGGTFAVDLNFTTQRNGIFGFGNISVVDGGVRDVLAYLPAGLIINPNAQPARCTEAQNEQDSCPDESAVGLADVAINFGGLAPEETGLYTLETPPGVAAAFSFDAAGVGIYPHVFGGLHAGDYALSSVTTDILQRFQNQLLGSRFQFWGDPSDPVHDFNRSECAFETGREFCPVDPQARALITLPTSCRASLPMEVEADSWGTPGAFHHRSAEVTDSLGNPNGVTGCNAVEFEPTLEARPTTNVADAPSGLEAELQIPEHEAIGTLAESNLKEAVVTLPEGVAINPSSANGLEGCSSAQIGIDPGTGVANGNPVTCPDASKIGTVEVDTSLLDHPAAGAVYIATPHDNPFDSLLAIYVVIDDKLTGTLVKLAGHVEADPQTGQLTTTFAKNPQLPFSAFKLHFFGGAGAPLRTPPTCGTYQTTSEMTPWSGNPPATPHDEYEISQAPGGGSCPTSSGTEPNAPSFDAGTVSPIAGAYSPMVVNLRRNDGSQEFSSVTLTPPPGLVGKLAGIPYCPESALKAAEGKTGNEEKASPSCPAASKVGTVTVGAGAGPAPYYTTGSAYLTGPYKGAPLSLAIVTPATAGPYDLGTVVVRTALNLNPETAQITAVSDPLPHILQGIPLDVRSIQVKLDRNQFTLNGTSCNPLAFTGSELSVLGQSSPLSERFQLGECAPLPFKPKLSFRLKGKTNRGGDPAFSATLTMPPGSANIAAAKVALPKSEFLDNAHIGTVCTRVQFAEGGGHGEHCPAASVYGFAKATTPLLDGPVEGPVFLRSSDHELPDLVAALKGQISVDLDGRVDSVNGGIRNSFEIVPDAPVTSFTLEMAGGAKGLLENSTNICRGTHRAAVEFTAQNGKVADLQPALKNSKCAHAKKHRHHRAKRHQRHAVR